MNIKRKTGWLAMGFIMAVAAAMQGCSATSQGKNDGAARSDTARSIAQYFSEGTTKKMTQDAEGFIRRWLLLEPINKPNLGNTVFIDS